MTWLGFAFQATALACWLFGLKPKQITKGNGGGEEQSKRKKGREGGMGVTHVSERIVKFRVGANVDVDASTNLEIRESRYDTEPQASPACDGYEEGAERLAAGRPSMSASRVIPGGRSGWSGEEFQYPKWTGSLS
ncbi:hypothetical protein B0H19DRAFT_1065372 [Mycena capillaripes]|nr:hypothetical protein B0H19DRAFT_1065372 [Mycena capillaripes]